MNLGRIKKNRPYPTLLIFLLTPASLASLIAAVSSVIYLDCPKTRLRYAQLFLHGGGHELVVLIITFELSMLYVWMRVKKLLCLGWLISFRFESFALLLENFFELR